MFILQASLVSTSETVCLRYFMDILMKKRIPVMLVGSAGSGKSIIVAEKLATLPDNYNTANVPLNYYTTSGKLYYRKSYIIKLKYIVVYI